MDNRRKRIDQYILNTHHGNACYILIRSTHTGGYVCGNETVMMDTDCRLGTEYGNTTVCDDGH